MLPTRTVAVLLTGLMRPLYPVITMFNVSRTVLGVIAAIAIVLLILGIAASFFPGYIIAAILGIYIVVVLAKGLAERCSSTPGRDCLRAVYTTG